MRWVICATLVASISFTAVSADAATARVGMEFKVTEPVAKKHWGGPFELTQAGHPDNNFWSFCVEFKGNIEVDGKVPYAIDGIGSETTGQKPQHHLTGYSAWLFTMFSGTKGQFGVDSNEWKLPTLITDGGITDSEYDILQKAIWAGMVSDPSQAVDQIGAEEPTSGHECDFDGDSLSWADLDALGIGKTAFNESGWGGTDVLADQLAFLGDVRIISLVDPQGNDIQDQLTINPVPKTASLSIWAMFAGLAVALAWRNRRRLS